jgi:ABC-type molybdate transport system ATPase subunit
VLFVSHDMGLVKRLADRAILMWKGEIKAQGAPADVVNRYVGLVHEREGEEQPAGEGLKILLQSSHRHGDGASRIADLSILGADGETHEAVDSGAPVRIRVQAKAQRDLDKPVVGILIRNRLGVDVFGTNTKIEGKNLGQFRAGETLEVQFAFDCLLAAGEYTLTAATQHWDGASQDWLDDALAFQVHDRRTVAGLASLPVSVEWRNV